MEARAQQEYRDEAYRIYISEMLRLLPQGKSLKISYSDIVNNRKVEDHRTGKEVAEQAAKKMGVKINWGGEN